MKRITLVLALGLLWGCSSGGPYGYARTYVPSNAEENAVQDAVEYDPVMARRQPHEWYDKKVSFFGVVKQVNAAPDGGDDVIISMRRLQDRNLCSTHEEDSCRVTVTDQEFTTLHLDVHLKPEEPPVRAGSLLRVVGKLRTKNHPTTGNTVIVPTYYRHWPSNEYVTLAAREFMRQ